jgi:hypothetical protein
VVRVDEDLGDLRRVAARSSWAKAIGGSPSWTARTRTSRLIATSRACSK